MDPLNVSAKFEVRAFPVPEILGGTVALCGITPCKLALYKYSCLLTYLTALCVASRGKKTST